MAPENWTASCIITGHLAASLRGQQEFQMANHSPYLQEGRAEVHKRSVVQAGEAWTETLAGSPVQDTCRLRQAMKTGSCLTVQPLMANRTKLGVQEW